MPTVQFNDFDQLRWYTTFNTIVWEIANKQDEFNLVDPDAITEGIYKAFVYSELLYSIGTGDKLKLSDAENELFYVYKQYGMLDYYYAIVQHLSIKKIVSFGYGQTIKPTIQTISEK